MSDTADTLHRPAEPAPQPQGQRFWRALDERLGLSGLQTRFPSMPTSSPTPSAAYR